MDVSLGKQDLSSGLELEALRLVAITALKIKSAPRAGLNHSEDDHDSTFIKRKE